MDNHTHETSLHITSANAKSASPTERFKRLEKIILATGSANEKAALEKARVVISRLNKNKESNEQFQSFIADNHFMTMINILKINCSAADIVVNGSVFKTLDKLFDLVIRAVPTALSLDQQFDEQYLISFFEIMQKYGEYDMLTIGQKSVLKKAILEGCRAMCVLNKSKWSGDIAKQLSAVLSALRNGSRCNTDVDLDE